MNARISLLLLVALSLCTVLEAQTVRKYSNEFLAIGVGGRALGMSGTQVAFVNDGTAGYWNPAGLLGISSDAQINVMHSEYFAGIAKYDYASFGKAIDSTSAIGFSFIRFGVDDIPNTTELIDANGVIDYDRITRFSAADYAFLASYARQLGSGLKLGANAKVVHRRVGDFGKAWGIGLDAGLQYEKGKWQLGAMVRDVTTTVNAWSYELDSATVNAFTLTGNEIPENSTEITVPKIILGGARYFQLGEKVGLLAALDLDVTTDGQRNTLISTSAISVDPHLGLEAGLNGQIFLRAGIGNIQEVQPFPGETEYTFQPNFGLGVKLGAISLDYALTDIGNQSDVLYSNVFSLKFDIDKKRM